MQNWLRSRPPLSPESPPNAKQKTKKFLEKAVEAELLARQSNSKLLKMASEGEVAETYSAAFAYIVVIKRNGKDGGRFPLVDDQCFIGRCVGRWGCVGVCTPGQ
jgi:hypothetical protein